MKWTPRDLLMFGGLAALGWILFQAGEVLVPFILAGVFAFALNPVVTLLTKQVRFPRTISILIVYLVLIGLTVTALVFITTRLIAEFRLVTAGSTIDETAREFIDGLPTWDVAGQEVSLKAFATQGLTSLSNYTSTLESRAVGIFQGALREGVYFLLFLVTAFYLLKDGRKIKSAINSLIPDRYHGDFLVIWAKVQVILGNYLRGQLLLMLIIGVLSYILFESLGIKYALILALMAGLLEVVPIVGPIVTAFVAAGVAFFTAANRFGLDPTALSMAILGGCLVIQQLENYVIVPGVYSRLTSLHPALVMFVVIIGGAVFGPIGFILAVPTIASIKVIAEYLASKP